MPNKRKNPIIINPSSSSLPDLSNDLTLLYGALSEDNKRVFMKIYRFLWGVVCPLSRFVSYSGVLHSYWLVDHLRLKYSVNYSDLSLLTYLYHMTNKGRKCLNSALIYNNPLLDNISDRSRVVQLHRLKLAGYITRSRRDPAFPHSPGSPYSRPVFLRLTVSGVQLIEQIEKDLHNILFRTSLDDLRGVKIKKQ